MSFVSTLEKARDFLLLAPDLPVADVLQAANARRAEFAAKSVDAKSSVLGRQAATRKLKELETLLPQLEIEAEITALEATTSAPAGPHVHKLRLEEKKLGTRVAKLPEGDERTIFNERLRVVQASLHDEPKPKPPERDPAADRSEISLATGANSRRSEPDRGDVLRLVPHRGMDFTGPVPIPLRFVARSRFLAGREEKEQASRADFLVPSTLTKVSRGNTLLTRQGSDIFVQDGDGARHSTNGSRLDEHVLKPEPARAIFTRERTLILGQVFAVAVQIMPGEAPAGPPIDSPIAKPAPAATANTLSGAMRFVPRENVPLPLVAAWVFTDATIGSAPGCAIRLAQHGLAEQHARIHFWQGGFWIESLRSENLLRIGDSALPKRAALPLHQGDIVTIGSLTYQVFVDA